jgi:FMN phosphatase YigB (HAD superfamily)
MRRSSRPVRAAIFDIGATLITGPPVAPNKVIAGLMKDVTAAEVASVIMASEFDSPEDVCRALERPFGQMTLECRTGVCELWDAQSSAPVEIDGATETVLALKDKGIRIGLLSDIWSPYYAGVCKAIPEIVDAADAIVLSCREGERKPSNLNFISALTRLEVDADEAVMIGDTYTHDIAPALELGMLAVWVVARPDREAEDIIKVIKHEAPAPTASVARISEVAGLDIFANEGV